MGVNGQTSRSEASRARILASATKFFAEKGLDGARVDEIAEDSGINKRMIYSYFGSKEDLYREVLLRNYESIFDSCKNAFNLNDDPKANITRAVREYFYFLARNPSFVRLSSWEALNRGRSAEKVLPKFIDLIELEFDAILKDAINQKVIKPDVDIHQVVLSVQALCLTYFNRREIIQPFWNKNMLSEEMLELRLKHILDLLFNGILKHREDEV